MKAKDARTFMRKTIRFRSNRTMRWRNSEAIGTVAEVRGREIYVANDWHDLKNFEVLEVLS